MKSSKRILDGLDLSGARGLQIGDLSHPLVAKSEGEICYVDYLAQDCPTKGEAEDKLPADTRGVQADYVWQGRSLQEITGGQQFDYILAPNVLEYVPDPIRWIQELCSVLKPDGTIRLTVSDRYLLDANRRHSSRFEQVLDAYVQRTRTPLSLCIIEYLLHEAPRGVSSSRHGMPYPVNRNGCGTIGDLIASARSGVSRLVPCWTFTVASFALLLEDMNRYELLSLRCQAMMPASAGETAFAVALARSDDRDQAIDSWERARLAAENATATVEAIGLATVDSQRIAVLEQQLGALTASLQSLHSSTSWRITKPLRAIVINSRRVVRLAAAARASAAYRGGIVPMLSAALASLKSDGWAASRAKLLRHAGDQAGLTAQTTLYERWIAKQNMIDAEERRTNDPSRWSVRPLISVVMPTFDPPLELLERAVTSVRAQSYPFWELCIADDASTDPEVRRYLEAARDSDERIRLVLRDANGHISAASNSALEIARGEFVALLDHDDELHPMALHWVAKTIRDFPDAGLIFSDEDKIDEVGHRFAPYFKCELNYELLLSHNMISHLGVYRRTLLCELGGFREGFEGAQDYDVSLRAIERLDPSQIRHIPKVLYHWRVHEESTASGGEAKPYAFLAGQRAIAEHLQRVGLDGEVYEAPEAANMYRVRLAHVRPEPSVEIIIPTRDRADLMRMSVGSVLAKTTYANYRICIVDNGSVDEEALAFFDSLKHDPRIRIVRDDRPFNFSTLNNLGVQTSGSEFICLLNNDIEVISGDWLAEMVSHANRPGIGCVGARLWYPDNTLQHGGVILGVLGIAGHAHKHLPRGAPGYFGRAVLQQACSAVTAACLLVRRSIFIEVGGLDDQLAVAFNDVDFCLRVREAGYRNVWTPYAELYHHESVSRGYEDNPEKRARFLREIEFMRTRWGRRLMSDPYYSPNLTLASEDFSTSET